MPNAQSKRSPAKRKAVSKKIRFEVFKRDSFTCQYCGATAPESVLHVDHITPVAQGGDNSIVNLVTSCASCNLGKKDTLLSDNAAVKRQKAQLDELNARREQLEMMVEWREGLQRIKEDELSIAIENWENLACGTLTKRGETELKKLVGRFGLHAVLDAQEVAVDTYITWEGDTPTQASLEEAFNKIGGICYYSTAPEHVRQLGRIRGILRKRLRWVNEGLCKRLMDDLHNAGYDIQELEEMARLAKSWTAWRELAEAMLEEG